MHLNLRSHCCYKVFSFLFINKTKENIQTLPAISFKYICSKSHSFMVVCPPSIMLIIWVQFCTRQTRPHRYNSTCQSTIHKLSMKYVTFRRCRLSILTDYHNKRKEKTRSIPRIRDVRTYMTQQFFYFLEKMNDCDALQILGQCY